MFYQIQMSYFLFNQFQCRRRRRKPNPSLFLLMNFDFYFLKHIYEKNIQNRLHVNRKLCKISIKCNGLYDLNIFLKTFDAQSPLNFSIFLFIIFLFYLFFCRFLLSPFLFSFFELLFFSLLFFYFAFFLTCIFSLCISVSPLFSFFFLFVYFKCFSSFFNSIKLSSQILLLKQKSLCFS